MRPLADIRLEIERSTERRSELWHALAEAHDPQLAAELARLNKRLEELWEEQRIARARLRFGDRDRIVARARAEERLSRAA